MHKCPKCEGRIGYLRALKSSLRLPPNNAPKCPGCGAILNADLALWLHGGTLFLLFGFFFWITRKTCLGGYLPELFPKLDFQFLVIVLSTVAVTALISVLIAPLFISYTVSSSVFSSGDRTVKAKIPLPSVAKGAIFSIFFLVWLGMLFLPDRNYSYDYGRDQMNLHFRHKEYGKMVSSIELMLNRYRCAYPHNLVEDFGQAFQKLSISYPELELAEGREAYEQLALQVLTAIKWKCSVAYDDSCCFLTFLKCPFAQSDPSSPLNELCTQLKVQPRCSSAN